MANFIAKPNSRNMIGAKEFPTMFEAQNKQNELTEVEPSVPIDEWIVLGKLLEVNANGETSTPKYYPKMRKGEMVMVKFDYKDYE